MATKLPAAPAPETAAADDLAILHPDRTLVLGGRTIVLREYGFFEGLDVADRAAGFIADLIAASDDGALRYAQVRRLFGRIYETLSLTPEGRATLAEVFTPAETKE